MNKTQTDIIQQDIKDFIECATERSSTEWIQKRDLYNLYVKYCELNSVRPPVSISMFGRHFPNIFGIWTVQRKVNVDGEMIYRSCWLGIKIKSLK